MTAPNDHPVSFLFDSKAVSPETFVVSAFRGEEEISRPYCFEIDLVTDDPDIDMDTLLYEPATLKIEKDNEARNIHGVLAECGLSGALPDNRYCYRVVLRPRVWLLSMNRQNQIYQNLSVTEIIEEEIKGGKAKGSTRPAAAGLTGNDFELRLTREYPKREYTVQYDESDLNFISRLMEHEGLFYFFEQTGEQEKMIITDNNIHFAALQHSDTIPYRPDSGLGRTDDEAILSLNATTRRIPRKLVLKDYNYRTPHLPLQAEADVDDTSHGLISEYGAHFKTAEEGAVMARIRSEELYCAKRTFDGTSNSSRLQPGWRFKLDEHFREDFNAEYAVTRIDHQGRQPLEGTAGLNDDGIDAAGYDNRFTCILADVAYRPPRRTPKPRVPGLMNAHVDAAMLENRAEIDEQGRYKLILPFDLSGAAAGKASRYVRKAQPYGGQDMGMHFPLYKGTEVICTFVNGDPDRPIITGVVPNPMTASVVNRDNYTKNIVKTGHGSYFEFNDGKGPAEKAKEVASNNGRLAAQQQMQSMASISEPTHPARQSDHCNDAGDASGSVRPHLALQQQQQNRRLSSAEESSPGAGDDIWFRVDVPNYDGDLASYWRIGKQPSDDKTITGQPDHDQHISDGWFEYTDGRRTIVTQQDRYSLTYGDECAYTEGLFVDAVRGERWQFDDMVSYDFKSGVDTEVFLGGKLESSTGLAAELFFGLKYESNLAASVAMNSAFEVNYNLAAKYEASVDYDLTVSGEIEQEADKKILLKVDPDDTGSELWFEQIAPVVFGAAGGVTALIAAFSSVHNIGDLADDFGSDDRTKYGWRNAGKAIAGVAGGASALLYLAGLINALADIGRRTRKGAIPDAPRAQLLMDKRKIELKYELKDPELDKATQKQYKIGSSSVTMDETSVVLKCGRAEVILSDKNIQLKCGDSGIFLGDQAGAGPGLIGKTYICGKEIVIGTKRAGDPVGADHNKSLWLRNGRFLSPQLKGNLGGLTVG